MDESQIGRMSLKELEAASAASSQAVEVARQAEQRAYSALSRATARRRAVAIENGLIVRMLAIRRSQAAMRGEAQ